MSGVQHRPHETLPGIREQRGARVRHQSEVFAGIQPRHNPRDPGGLVVLVKRGQRGAEVVAGEELTGAARVFGKDTVDHSEDFERPG